MQVVDEPVMAESILISVAAVATITNVFGFGVQFSVSGNWRGTCLHHYQVRSAALKSEGPRLLHIACLIGAVEQSCLRLALERSSHRRHRLTFGLFLLSPTEGGTHLGPNLAFGAVGGSCGRPSAVAPFNSKLLWV